MGEHSWRDVIGDAEIAKGLAEFFDELESYGWYARSRWGDTGLRFWPDGARAKQIAIDLGFPLNDYRREAIREEIQTHIAAKQKEGGTQ